MSLRLGERQKSFKKGIDSDESRRRREDTAIQIRKTIKEDRLNQRRRMVGTLEV
jgi:importin subunit alpha-1